MRPARAGRSPQRAGSGSGRWEGRSESNKGREKREKSKRREKKEGTEKKEGREGAGRMPRGWAPPVRALAPLFWLSGRAVALPGESGIVRPPARSAQAPGPIPRLADPDPPPPPPPPRPPSPPAAALLPRRGGGGGRPPFSPSPSPGKSPKEPEGRGGGVGSSPFLSPSAPPRLPHRPGLSSRSAVARARRRRLPSGSARGARPLPPTPPTHPGPLRARPARPPPHLPLTPSPHSRGPPSTFPSIPERGKGLSGPGGLGEVLSVPREGMRPPGHGAQAGPAATLLRWFGFGCCRVAR
ncbi:proline-rich protein HaeIII subfamily 1-like [Melozone crissalis]|uniref:proline-rich protein HaeIII subfamily 1-like n=1 Tax=Melozone crissalis TaxID=40204 RepID=UPI0023DAC8D9|nr:proline-rich protein HaeIII subfamily 1-like [Melozone crissalis]